MYLINDYCDSEVMAMAGGAEPMVWDVAGALRVDLTVRIGV